MLAAQDIKKIGEILDSKLDSILDSKLDAKFRIFGSYFYTKEEIDDKFYSKTEMDAKFSQVLTAIDGVMKDKTAKDQEMIIMAYRQKNVENWIDKAAPKIGLKFKH